jgi:hypothetical protein
MSVQEGDMALERDHSTIESWTARWPDVFYRGRRARVAGDEALPGKSRPPAGLN